MRGRQRQHVKAAAASAWLLCMPTPRSAAEPCSWFPAGGSALHCSREALDPLTPAPAAAGAQKRSEETSRAACRWPACRALPPAPPATARHGGHRSCYSAAMSNAITLGPNCLFLQPFARHLTPHSLPMLTSPMLTSAGAAACGAGADGCSSGWLQRTLAPYADLLSNTCAGALARNVGSTAWNCMPIAGSTLPRPFLCLSPCWLAGLAASMAPPSSSARSAWPRSCCGARGWRSV